MKTNRIRLLALTAVMMCLVVVLVILASNLVFTSYLKQEASRVIQRDMALLGPQGNLNDSGVDTSFDSSPVTPLMMFVTREYLPLDIVYGTFTPLERAIAAFSKQDGDISGNIKRTRLLGEDLFIAQSNTWSEPDVLDETILIVYANITPLEQFVRMLNTVFLGVLAAFGALASWVGMRLGRKIDTTQQRTRQFFANASHELKTPLMTIAGFADGIATGVVKDAPAAAEIILEEGDRMAALVDELLFLSKIEGGHLSLRKSTFSLAELLSDCVSELAQVALQNDLQIRFPQQDIQLTYLGDAQQLRRAFINVLSNALRYAQNLVVLRLEVEKRQVQVHIEDDGEGIQPQDLPHVFERFYTGKKGASGIGLSIAREIVLLHGGSLHARNGSTGAVFTFVLPRG